MCLYVYVYVCVHVHVHDVYVLFDARPYGSPCAEPLENLSFVFYVGKGRAGYACSARSRGRNPEVVAAPRHDHAHASPARPEVSRPATQKWLLAGAHSYTLRAA